MREIMASEKLKLQVVVTCMHLARGFGYTVAEIEKDGFPIYEKLSVLGQADTALAMATSVGKALTGFASVFSRLKPNFVVVLGDRGEALAAAITANYLKIPLAHIHGGEVSGHIDGILRHAITKLAHLHFPATQKSADRILKLGEEPWRVTVVGAPALDLILHKPLPDKQSLCLKYKIDASNPLLLLVQHPVIAEEDQAGRQMEITFKAVSALGFQVIVIYPNADAGGRRMIKVVKKNERRPLVTAFKSIPHEDYLGLMRFASVLIGNSSSGIIEAPSFKLPVVNVGSRQEGRERGTNVIDVPHNYKAILAAVKKALYDNKFKNVLEKGINPYGDGHASPKIVRVLNAVKLGNRLLQKQMTY
jgi:UDP-hydrolysing UDP-N-acetyl-D-glucosamine 2-epimerase